jgi:hypothetical protein
MDELLEPDLMEAAKEVCMHADSRGMPLAYTREMRRMMADYESGVWAGLTAMQKLPRLYDIEFLLTDPPYFCGEIYEGRFTSAAELAAGSRYDTLVRQMQMELKLEIQSQGLQWQDAYAEPSEPQEPVPLLTPEEQDLGTVLDSISMTPEMGDHFMVTAVYIRHLLSGGGWARLSIAEKQRSLEMLDAPELQHDIARHERGEKLVLMLGRVRRSLGGEAGGV